MNKWFQCIVLCCLSALRVSATEQAFELIIYQGDTLPMKSFPLESYLGEFGKRFEQYPAFNGGCSMGQARGYIGLWSLEEDELILLDVYLCGDRDRSIYRDLFGNEVNVRANWYSGPLAIQHGKVIRYQPVGDIRVYEEETLIQIQIGIAQDIQEFVNGYRPGDKGFPSDPDSIKVEIHYRIDWDKLPDPSKDHRLLILIQWGESDSLAIMLATAPKAYVKEVQRVLDGFPNLRKFYSRGKPLFERYICGLVLSEERRKNYFKYMQQ